MKTCEELKAMIEDKLIFMAKHPKSSREFRSAKKEYEFYTQCLLLVENSLTQEALERGLKKLSDQYQKIKINYYEEFWYGKESKFREENKRPSIAKFESRSGANKIKQQIKTYKFLQG